MSLIHGLTDAQFMAVTAQVLLERSGTGARAHDDLHQPSGEDKMPQTGRTTLAAWMPRHDRTALAAWMRDGIASATAPFDTDLICIEDIRARVPPELISWRRPTGQALGRLLDLVGAERVGVRLSLGWFLTTTGEGRGRLYAVRNQDCYQALWQVGDIEQIRWRFKDQYAQAALARADCKPSD